MFSNGFLSFFTAWLGRPRGAGKAAASLPNTPPAAEKRLGNIEASMLPTHFLLPNARVLLILIGGFTVPGPSAGPWGI